MEEKEIVKPLFFEEPSLYMLPRRRSVEVLPLELQTPSSDNDSQHDSQHDSCSSSTHSRLDATHRRNSAGLLVPPSSSQEETHHPGTTMSTSTVSRPSPFVIQVTLLAGLGGILFGYDLGVISGALPQLMDTFHLSTKQSEWVVSILYLGGGLGAAVGGSLCDVFGRKAAILYTDIAFLLGALVLCVAPNFATILLGRTIVGFAIAVSGIADVSYLHEIAPLQFREPLSVSMRHVYHWGFSLPLRWELCFQVRNRDGEVCLHLAVSLPCCSWEECGICPSHPNG